jgi:hypothetical protein
MKTKTQLLELLGAACLLAGGFVAPALAQDCSAHASAHRSYYISGNRTPITPDQAAKDVRDRINDGYYVTYCPREWGARCTIGRRGVLPTAPNYREVLLLFADIMDRVGDGDPYYPWLACLARQQAAQLTPKRAPSPAPSVATTRPSPSSGTASTGTAPPAATSKSQAGQPQASAAPRPPRPKRHYAEGEAHRCLSLIKATDKTLYGGFINTCDFPVRFAYCAYKPKKGAWSESVDCEGGTGKLSGHSEIKPHERSAHHTLGAEKVLWFACRADGEGFEVGDAEFDRSGPFIRGRCYKWGERS